MPYRISIARNAKGWSQSELAEKIGTTQNQITRWETGKRDPKASDVLKLSNALGVTVSYLLGVNNVSSSNALADDERELIDLYRSTDARGRDAIMAIARSQSGDEGASEAGARSA